MPDSQERLSDELPTEDELDYLQGRLKGVAGIGPASPELQRAAGSVIEQLRAELQARRAAAVDCKRPEQWFTAGSLRYACCVGWHAARGESDNAKACYEVAMVELGHSQSVEKQCEKAADAIAWWLFDNLKKPGPGTTTIVKIFTDIIRQHLTTQPPAQQPLAIRVTVHDDSKEPSDE